MAQTGRVLQFDGARGYGFIVPDAGGDDVFLHANDFDEDEALLSPGARVEFEVMAGGRGKKAYSVRIADEAAAGEETETRSASTGAATVAAASPAPARPASDDEDGLCDVLTGEELRLELTELFLASSSGLTGAQILGLREEILRLARKHGWVEE